MKKLFSNKKGVVLLYLTFFIICIIIVLLGAVFAPMGVRFNTVIYEAGEQILLDSNATISQINNSEVRAALYNSLDEALDSTETNIDVNSDIFQYSWVIALILAALIAFMFTRRTIEASGGFI